MQAIVDWSVSLMGTLGPPGVALAILIETIIPPVPSELFLPLAGFDTRFVPLHVYFNQAMDAMWNHLKAGAALPASQVVRATTRGGAPGAAPAITAANLPPLVTTPAAGSQIAFTSNVLNVPQ